MHLTFNIRCFIACLCASSFLSRKSAAPADRRMQCRLQPTGSLNCGLHPAQSFYSAVGIFSSQSFRITTLLMWFLLLGSSHKSNSATEIFSTWRSKVCRYHWWDYPYLEASQVYQITLKTDQSYRWWRSALRGGMIISIPKTNGKASQESPYSHFHSNEICVLFSKILSFRIHSFKYIPDYI